MALPRKGILIRLAIYLPLIGFFGWRYLSKYLDGREQETTVDEQQRKLEQLPPDKFQTFTLPDGTIKKVPILTPEEAEDIYGIAVPEQTDAETETKPSPAPDPKFEPEKELGLGQRASAPRID